jgi:hypothetical protein
LAIQISFIAPNRRERKGYYVQRAASKNHVAAEIHHGGTETTEVYLAATTAGEPGRPLADAQ